MLTNSSFELSPAQFQMIGNWQSDYYNRLRQADEDGDSIGELEIVFTLTSIGRRVVARIPWGGATELVLEDI